MGLVVVFFGCFGCEEGVKCLWATAVSMHKGLHEL